MNIRINNKIQFKRFKLLLSFIFLFNHCQICAQIIPEYSVTALTSESVGYYFLTPFKLKQKNPVQCHQLILDKNGDPVYFKKFPDGKPATDFKVQSNGQMSYFFGAMFYLMNSSFNLIDSVGWPSGLLSDGHDFNVTESGHYVMLGIEEVKTDLSNYLIFKNNKSPGSKNATVRHGVVLELDKNKKTVFLWNSKKTYKIEDIDQFYLDDSNSVSIPHINSVEPDIDKNFIISCRNFNEVAKINRKDSIVAWRLGGKKNQFHFTNDSGKFMGQHSAQRLSNGNIVLFDNGMKQSFHPSAAREYAINEKDSIATLVWSYTDNKNSSSSRIGNVKRLANKNTLINYGVSSNSNVLFNVVNPSGKKIFELVFKDTLRSYRVFNYKKLPWKLDRPKIKYIKEKGQLYLEVEGGNGQSYWSNDSIGKRIMITRAGVYFAFVQVGGNGYLCSNSIYINSLLNPFVPKK